MELGQQYVVCRGPDSDWIPRESASVEDFKRLAAILNTAGSAALREGLVFGFHNHAQEFLPLEDRLPYDVLLAECDPRLVAMELDLYWISRTGRSPLEYLNDNPGRFPLLHLKDMGKNGEIVNVGQGVIDFPAILEAAERAGGSHYFVEHDDPPAPLEDARVSYISLRGLGI